jgi:hypothetical protein
LRLPQLGGRAAEGPLFLLRNLVISSAAERPASTGDWPPYPGLEAEFDLPKRVDLDAEPETVFPLPALPTPDPYRPPKLGSGSVRPPQTAAAGALVTG